MPVIKGGIVWRQPNGGVTTPLVSQSVRVWQVSTNTLFTYVTTDTNGVMADITVPGSVGDLWRLAVENDGQGRADSIEVASQ